jgi:diaminohydroxyphosphoribosylaminopyrimidine deaminase/5-amino-6-(5-phosphoribosylamino)uracil reductase
VILDSGVRRVVAAMRDPDPRVSGKGFAELRAHGVHVDEGLLADDAARLNRAFVSVKLRQRPMVVLKAATSLDAMVAAAPGARTQLSSPEANRKTQWLRAAVDAVAVGSETMLVDDPLLTARDVQRVRPLVRVVFDRRLRTPPTARVFSTLSDGPVIMMTSSTADAGRRLALEAVGATIVDTTSLEDALHALTRWDVSTLLVEGGPRVQAALCRAALVDRLHLIVAPQMLGPGALRWLDSTELPWSALSQPVAETRGPDIWIEADVHGDR